MNKDVAAILVSMAKYSICAAVCGKKDELELFEKMYAHEMMNYAQLSEMGATFVTLAKNKQLRACIGTLRAHRPLWQDISKNAVAAALHDPRFSPVGEDELSSLTVEVSVLSEPQELEYSGADDLLEKLQPGIDGLILEYLGKRATFLPQVWEQLSEKEVFLDALCRKAGLEEGLWKTNAPMIWRYSVEKYGPEKIDVATNCA